MEQRIESTAETNGKQKGAALGAPVRHRGMSEMNVRPEVSPEQTTAHSAGGGANNGSESNRAEEIPFGPPESDVEGGVTGEEEPSVRYSAHFPGLVDLVTDVDGNLRFLVKGENGFGIECSHEHGGETLYPPPPDKIPWIPPRGEEVLRHIEGDDDATLHRDLVEHLKSAGELESEDCHRFLAAWLMLCHLQEHIQYLPVVLFHAPPERGKSRMGRALTYAGWRGIIQVTVNEAHIIRFCTHHRATLFFDAMDFWKKVERNGAEDILLNRFERGAKLARVFNRERGPFEDMEFFEVFGPTLIATNESINRIMESRAVVIGTPRSSRLFHNDILPEDGLPYRERLAAFRARWLDKTPPEADKPVHGRLGDILRPVGRILKIVGGDDSWFAEFARKQERERRNQQVTVEAAALEAIGKRAADGARTIPKADILAEVNGILEGVSANKLGRVLREMGFADCKHGGKRAIRAEPELLKRLLHRHGIRQSEPTGDRGE